MKINQYIVCMLLPFLWGCSVGEEVQTEPRLVKTMIVGSEQGTLERSFPGRVIAGQRADLAFQVSGTLSELPAKDGQLVTQGQMLAMLNARDFQNHYDSAKSTREIAELNYERGKKLVTSGTIARVTFDELRNKYEVATANENIAKKALEDTKILAPFTGMIARVYVDNFQEVQAKEKILTLQNVEDIDIIIDVPERDIIHRQSINNGEAVNQRLEHAYVIFDALPQQKFNVTIKEYATEADPTTQTYRVRLSMKSPKNITILPGMTANLVTKNAAKTSQDTLLPATAVAVDADGKFYVWVVKEDMTVTKRLVTVGEMTGNNIHVLSGVEPGQRIVTAGVDYLQEGMTIRIFTNAY